MIKLFELDGPINGADEDRGTYSLLYELVDGNYVARLKTNGGDDDLLANNITVVADTFRQFSGDGAVEVHVPLRALFNEKRISGLTYRPKDKVFTLDLAIPVLIPLPFSNGAASNGPTEHFFHIRLKYPISVTPINEIGRFKTIEVIDKDGKLKHIVFDSQTVHRLGQFVFSDEDKKPERANIKGLSDDLYTILTNTGFTNLGLPSSSDTHLEGIFKTHIELSVKDHFTYKVRLIRIQGARLTEPTGYVEYGKPSPFRCVWRGKTLPGGSLPTYDFAVSLASVGISPTFLIGDELTIECTQFKNKNNGAWISNSKLRFDLSNGNDPIIFKKTGSPSTKPPKHPSFFEYLNSRFHGIRSGMSIIEGELPISTAPTIQALERNQELAKIKIPLVIECTRSLDCNYQGHVWSDQIEPPKLSVNGNVDPLTVSFPAFVLGSSHTSNWTLINGDETNADWPATPPLAGNKLAGFARFVLTPLNDPEPANALINGLMLRLAYKKTANLPDNREGTTQTPTNAFLDLRSFGEDRYSGSWYLNNIDLIAAHPLTDDVSRTGGQRQRSLIIALAPDGDAGTKLSLSSEETFGDKCDRELRFWIQDRSTDKGVSAEHFIIGTSPVSIIRSYSASLSSRGDSSGTVVAEWSSADRNWTFKSIAENYRYRWPPQVIGEAMDKPGRLHIHDAIANGPRQLLLPAPVSTVDSHAQELTHAVEMRLSPPAELIVKPSDVLRDQVLPEFATYQLFRGRGERGLGVALAGLRAEFLYGLMVDVDPTKDVAWQRRSRVAEIEALTGRYPNELDENNFKVSAAERRWNLLRHGLDSRVERLELWTDDPDAGVDFAPARFSTGARFALRRTALHAHPTDKTVTPIAGNDDDPPSIRWHPQGLRGGALWPIESANLLKELQKRPDSTGGSLGGIALGPTGGSADQSAAFLNGIVRIVSETRNGFVQRQQVEVLGRIGVLWHRAKHVVVYERTVNLSAQFTPIPASATRTRRPVLRKVREYIEILEPERRYPEGLTTPPRTAGVLAAVRFGSRIIAVDSSWARDIGDYGWEVPLWDRGAAEQRPQVYPIPDISFVSHGEGEGDDAFVLQPVLNPDNLFFFTDVKETTPDTDTWAPRQGVDFANLPAPRPAPKDLNANHDSLPPIETVPTGFSRYTWRLGASTRRSMLNAGRSDNPVFATLDTLTLQRATPVIDPAGAESLTKLRQIKWGDAGNPLPGTEKFWSEKDAQPPYNHKAQPIIDLFTAIPDENENDKEIWKRSLRKVIEEIGTLKNNDAVKAIHQYLSNGATTLAENRSHYDALLKSISNPCDRYTTDLARLIAAKKSLLAEVIAEAQQRIANDINSVNGDLQEKKAQWKADVASLLKEALSSISLGSVRLDAEIARAEAVVKDLARDLVARIDSCDARLEQVIHSYDLAKPWSEARRTEYETARKEVGARLKAGIDETFEATFQRLAVDLGEYGQRLAAWLRKAIVKSQISLRTPVEELSNTLAGAEGDPSNKSPSWNREKWDESKKTVKEKIITAITEIETSVSHPISELRDNAKTLARGLETAVPKLISDSFNNVLDEIVPHDADTVTDEMKQAIANLRDRFLDALDQIDPATAPVVEDLKYYCHSIADQLQDTFSDLGDQWLEPLYRRKRELETLLKDLTAGVAEYSAFAEKMKGDIRRVVNDLAIARERVEAFGERAADAVGRLTKGGLKAAPGNILNLCSVAATAPELPDLDYARDRLRYYYDAANDIIDLTPVEAYFGRLGDALKAIGLSLPIKGLGDCLIPDDLNFDIGKVFPNFGGLRLDKLFKGVKLPPKAKDAIKVTHQFDKKAGTASVNVDVRMPVPSRSALFSVGPFKCDLVRSDFNGFVRVSASKESPDVEKRAQAELTTDLEVIVGGQMMVALRRLGLRYDQARGLDFDLDPKNIELNRVMKVVNDAMATLFPDEIGGLTIVKNNGVPIGMRYEYDMPPTSIAYGTTGISNIALSCHFELVAYPEFIFANRFSIATPEQPFLFSVFIIGGAGWLTIETVYRPGDEQLLVVVEGAMGGSAFIGFAFSGVTGSVFITLSAVLGYRKLIGSSGGGLRVALEVLVAGLVDVLGIVHASIAVLLRLTYLPSGNIDAKGTLSLKIRISRFFKLRVRRNVVYHLRGKQKSNPDSKATTRMLQSRSE